MRGFHRCEFCSDDQIFANKNGVARMLGSAEVWLPGEGVLYAAPNLIVHYIGVHGYQPPDEYIRAIDVLDVDEWVPPRDYVQVHRGS